MAFVKDCNVRNVIVGCKRWIFVIDRAARTMDINRSRSVNNGFCA